MRQPWFSYKIFLLILSLLLLFSFKLTENKSTLRWGLIGERHQLVVDETEILVIEYLEFVENGNGKVQQGPQKTFVSYNMAVCIQYTNPKKYLPKKPTSDRLKDESLFSLSTFYYFRTNNPQQPLNSVLS